MISKVNSTQNSPTFGWINIAESKNFANRLKREELGRFKDLVQLHSPNPIEVVIKDSENSSKRLEAEIIPAEGMEMPIKDYKERFFEQFGSPLKFIERIAKLSDKMLSEHVNKKLINQELEEIKKINNKQSHLCSSNEIFVEQ